MSSELLKRAILLDIREAVANNPALRLYSPAAIDALASHIAANYGSIIDIAENGSVVMPGGGTIADELIRLKDNSSTAYLFEAQREARDATPVVDSNKEQSPSPYGNLDAAGVAALSAEGKITHGNAINARAVEGWRKQVGPVAVSPEDFARMSAEEKIAHANRVTAEKNGWAR